LTGVSTTSPLGALTPTTTVDEHGGGVPEGAHVPRLGGVTLATFAIA